MKPLLKRLFFRLAGSRPLSREQAVVLMYHSISGHSDEFTVSPAVFEQQMSYLSENGIPVIALSELVRRLRSRETLGGAVVITFDDGYRDNYTNAFPILKKYGFPATIFVVTDSIGTTDDTFEYLSVSEIKEMAASGLIDIEPHTKTHPHLSREPVERQRDEVIGSKQAIEAITGESATLFAYPYGDGDHTTITVVRESGFEAAVSVVPGTVQTGAELLRIPRNAIDSTTSTVQFRGIVSGAVDRYEALKKWL